MYESLKRVWAESNHQQTYRKEITHGKKSTSYNAPQCIRNEALCRKGQLGSFQGHSDLQTGTWPGYQAEEQEGEIDSHHGNLIQEPLLVKLMVGLKNHFKGASVPSVGFLMFEPLHCYLFQTQIKIRN
jgi:hypothetical protein